MRTFSLKRAIPLFILIIGLFLFFYFRLYRFLSFESLKEHRQWLLDLTNQHYIYSALAFIAIYIIATAISIPGAVFLTVLGGFLFGYTWGTLYVVVSTTIGASSLFLAAKTAFGGLLADRAGPWVRKMENGFQENAFSYLLLLRFIPLFPFWIVNIAPAIIDVRFRTFVIATFIGIIPGSFVYALLGNGLGSLFAQGKTPDMTIILHPSVIVPLIALGILSIVPILYKRLTKKRT